MPGSQLIYRRKGSLLKFKTAVMPGRSKALPQQGIMFDNQ